MLEDTQILRYRLATIRSSGVQLHPDLCGVRLIGGPRVGRPMVMYLSDGNRRLQTSRVLRVFRDVEGRGTYVETRNTLYLLQEHGGYPLQTIRVAACS